MGGVAVRQRQLSLFEDQRLQLDGAIELSLASIREYGLRYRHWACAYSGGKDSSATVALVAWAIKAGMVPAPESLTILYADTRMEIPPLQQTAMHLLADLQCDGFDARVVCPPMDKRFFVYMLGRGVNPPSNTFRWCTEGLKITPMLTELQSIRQAAGEKLLMLTGVRLGESAHRDQRIAISCSRDSGECGQGWFQVATPAAVADTLAPLLHWRLCHVYDWIYFDDRHGYDVSAIAAVYGESEVRTGCVGCNLASRDVALERLIRHHEWEHLRPLLELRPLYAELKKPRWRKRKLRPEKRKDGRFGENAQRMGPLTMPARVYGLGRVLDIQARAHVDLINAEEEKRIREMWAFDLWPEKWSADDADATLPIDAMTITSDNQVVIQSLLI
jgi:DNA sulfur modification protein DndC